jgi:DNA-binding response OmpR family regulator
MGSGAHGAKAADALAGIRPVVLVADDSPDIRELVTTVLERSGYETVEAANGREALELARLCRPDLLLLDVTMPGLDGYAVCEALRSEVRELPPVIFLTGHADPGAHVRGFEAGAVDYVVKPFKLSDLTARVESGLRVGHEAARSVRV